MADAKKKAREDYMKKDAKRKLKFGKYSEVKVQKLWI